MNLLWTTFWIGLLAVVSARSGSVSDRSGFGPYKRPGGVKSPGYLLRLYEKYSRGENTNGNTVHALLPKQGQIRGDSMLVFNLSSVHDQERILSAELHVRRRNLARRLRAGSLRLRVCHITQQRVPVLEDIVLSLNITGWQKYNISVPVRRVRETPSSYHLLGIRVELKLPERPRYHTLRWRRLTKLKLKPFILVFSNDSSTMEDLENSFLHSGTSGHLERALNRLRRSVGSVPQDASSQGLYFRYVADDSDENDDNISVVTVEHQRKMDSEDKKSGSTLPNFGQEAGNVETHREESDDDDDDGGEYDVGESEEKNVVPTGENLKGEGKHDNSLIPYPSVDGSDPWRRRRQRRRKHRRMQNKKVRRLPTWWHMERTHQDSRQDRVSPSASDNSCRRKKLSIDFNDMGWGEMIIAPARFDAYYCAGTCSFPFRKETRSTNHATIQSIASMLGVEDGEGGGTVPAPCCVPDAMDSLTLLYFEDKNVVLKTCPKMIVTSCACR